MRWKEDSLDIKPDVLSLLVGINDVGAVMDNRADAKDLAQFEKGYRLLLQQSRELNPGVLFVLGIPFVYPIGRHKENWRKWKNETETRADIVRNIAKDFDAVIIDYPKVFEDVMKHTSIEYWIWDGIHPTVFGHEIMAREWIRQVSRRLNFLENYDY
jgi:lysophospholipase L1-like esterase